MRSLSSVGLALSLVFGCLLIALVAELYYLLWWKNRICKREIEDEFRSPSREFLYKLCWKKSLCLSSTALNPQQVCSSVRITESTHTHEPQALVSEDLWPKAFGGGGVEDDELMRLQGFSGPPRFLFTIIEETKEDLLESEDGKSRKGSRSRSLSDVVLINGGETPFLTPIASPPYFTPPLTPMDSTYHHHHGFNPLFETSSHAEFSKLRSPSPPPKFKFLRDAEDKLYRRKLMEEAEKNEENGSFITLIVAKDKERELSLSQTHSHHNIQQYHSSSSQVLPLASSPSTLKSPTNKWDNVQF